MENISEHISFAEGMTSQTAVRFGIDNTPDEETIKRMKIVAEKCFEPIREHEGVPVIVSSFYRCWELNGNVPGSSKTSQHPQGEAIDFITKDMAKTFDWIRKNLEFDQLIWEYGNDDKPAWIHISYTEQRKNRQQVLRVHLDENKKMIWRNI